MIECAECREEIRKEENLVDYDQLPHHRDCLKKKYREDNPWVSDSQKKKFDEMIEDADKIVCDGESVRFVAFEDSTTGETE